MSASNEHVGHLADDYLHNLLDPPRAQQVEQHVATCRACAAALDDARRRLGLLKSLPPAEPRQNLATDTADQIEDHEKKQRRFRRRFMIGSFSALAAGLLLLVGFQIHTSNLKPTRADLLVLGQKELMPGTNASLRVRLTDGKAGTPMGGVPVTVSLVAADGKKQELGEAKTDDRGAANPRFKLPDWPDGKFELVVAARTPDGEEELRQPVTLKRSFRVMLSSDRPIYQPGQKVLLRSLTLRRPDLLPMQGLPTVFTISDPKGNIIFKDAPEMKPEAARYGLAATECQLDTEVTEGKYVVNCKVGDTETRLPIEVRRYVLPRFGVEVSTGDKRWYRPGEKAEVTVRARYFHGRPVTDAQVELQTITTVIGEQVNKSYRGKTDKEGTFRVTVDVPEMLVGRAGDGGDGKLRLEAVVKAEETQNKTIERIVSSKLVRVESYPEAGVLVRDVTNLVYAVVTRPDGVPEAKAKIKVTVPNMEVQDLVTDDQGAATFRVTPDGEMAEWAMEVTGANGKFLTRKSDRRQCGPATGDFLVRTDRATYKGGESIQVSALGSGIEPVFVDLVKDGQTMASETVDMKDGRGELTLDLPPDVSGTVQMLAYRFVEKGTVARKIRVLYIAPPAGLRVVTTLDKPEYRPGKDANLTVQLTDDKGAPLVGAVSLAAVDEAVFALAAGQRPGMEGTFFTLEQELLQPVYAVYDWDPQIGDGLVVRAAFTRAARNLGRREVVAPVQEVNPNIDRPRRNRDKDIRINREMLKVEDGLRAGAGEAPQPAAGPGSVGPHTLVYTTFPDKVQKVRDEKRMRQEKLLVAWVASLVVGLLIGYASLWLYLPSRVVLIVHAFLGGGLFVLMSCGMLLFMLSGVKSSQMVATEAASREERFFAAGRDGRWKEKAAMDRDKDRGPAKWAEEKKDEPWKEEKGDPQPQEQGEPESPRVRNDFPETLLWKPVLISDEQGRVPLSFKVADSITDWRLTVSAVSPDGRLGARQGIIKVFQSFFVEPQLPTRMTRGDELGLPVTVYNYEKDAQTVRLKLTDADWFACDKREAEVEVPANGKRTVRFDLKIVKAGEFAIQVEAVGKTLSDAVKRELIVDAGGLKQELSRSGSLDRPLEWTFQVPRDAIEGGTRLLVKLHPSAFTQVVDGLDGILRMPTGCFEQTSSAAYPNVLVLDYLKRTGKANPEIEAKARAYSQRGYQRLLGFEVRGGGFDWYGNPPAKLGLTAYGLMEFQDMARVIDVDASMIERTRGWLLSQRQWDGSWPADSKLTDQLTGTAYVAAAVFAKEQAKTEAEKTKSYLLANVKADEADPYLASLVALALQAMGEKSSATPYVDRLVNLANREEKGKVFWQLPQQGRTMFYGAGQSGDVETTAQAVLALVAQGGHNGDVRGGIAWLIEQKGPHGAWGSTQATILSLKALLAGGGATEEAERRIEVRVGDYVREVVIPKNKSEVMEMLNLSDKVKAGEGPATIWVTEKSKTGAGYQVVLRYHTPIEKLEKPEGSKGPLAITIDYDRTELAVGDVVRAKATARNLMPGVAPMVMLDLPVPPGFAAESDDFEKLVRTRRIARYQIKAGHVLVYLRELRPGAPLVLDYTLRATLPVRAAVPAGRVYEYYNPQKEGRSQGATMQVTARD